MPNLRNGTTYSFQVRAVNIHGASDASTPVELIPVTRPAAPYDFEAEGGDAQVELTWTVPDNGGDAIIRHQYQQSEDSQGFGQWQDIPDSGEVGNSQKIIILLQTWPTEPFTTFKFGLSIPKREGVMCPTLKVRDPKFRPHRQVPLENWRLRKVMDK